MAVECQTVGRKGCTTPSVTFYKGCTWWEDLPRLASLSRGNPGARLSGDKEKKVKLSLVGLRFIPTPRPGLDTDLVRLAWLPRTAKSASP